MLHVSFSAVVNVSKYCKPFLPNQILAIANLSVCGVLYVDKTLLTSNLNVFNLHTYLLHSNQMSVASWWDHLSWVLICHAFSLPEPPP